MKIDWSKAPEGATHFIIDSDGHVEDSFAVEQYDRYKDVGSNSYLMKSDVVGGGWIVLARPPHWNGEGLPPVGIECEVLWKGSWVKCEILAHRATFAVVYLPNEVKCGLAIIGDCRPIRTPEQIAADKREKAIEDLRHLLSKVACDDYHAAVAMIDAGYRKTEQEHGQ